MKKWLAALALSVVLLPGAGMAQQAKQSYRFVMVPKVVHPWFDEVVDGMKDAAKMLEQTKGIKVEIEYLAPQHADVVEQNNIIERAIATHPDGIVIDLLDAKGNRAVLDEAKEHGIPITAFDTLPPDDMHITAIGNDFCEQAKIASERLVQMLNGQGEVAIMMGFPTAPNHLERANCHEATFKKYPGIKLVAKGIDNDDIGTAQKQAAEIMQAHPNLRGWVECDAAGPIGVGQAIKEAGKVGKVLMVGLDDLPDMLQLIKEGVADSSSSTRPQMQGYWSTLVMWQTAMGVKTPKVIDTGIAIITKDNLTTYK